MAAEHKSQTDFYHRIRKNQIAPLYLFEGAERYLRNQALAELIDVAIDQQVRDFNYATISVTQGNLDQALAMAREFPMLSPRRIVIIKGFEAISDEKQLELLKEYLRAPSETTVLVFVSDGLDNRRNIATILRKSCEVVKFSPLEERESAPTWVRNYVAQAGSSIDPAAAAYLIGTTGVELSRLANELDKLMAYSGDSGEITRDEIDNLVRYSREHSNFELTDAILDGNRNRALSLLNRIYSNSSESPSSLPLLILGAIASNYRKMLAAKELMQQNAPNAEVAKAAGMPPFAVTRFNERVRQLETAQIIAGIELIAQTDHALKTSQATPRLQLEMLICQLCPER
jgi:DNA polymerase III subunit delta